MIRPQLATITPAVLPGLHLLFDACNTPVAKEWEFNPQRTIVALHNGEVVGFLASWWDGQPVAWIDMLLVLPKYRGQGIGAFLGYTMEAILRQQGAKVIRCVLDEGAELAAPLEKAGFSRVGTFLVMERHYNEA